MPRKLLLQVQAVYVLWRCYVNLQGSKSFIAGSGSVFSDRWWQYALKGFSESATGICSNSVMLTRKSSEPFVVGSGSVFSDRWMQYAFKGFSESSTGICSNSVMLTRKSSEPFVGGQKSGIQDWCVVLYRISFPCRCSRYMHSFGVMLTRQV